jgi:hypothetical protein
MKVNMEKFTSRNNELEVEELPIFNGEEIPVFDSVEFERSLDETDDDDDDDDDDDADGTEDKDIDVNDK